MSDPEFFDRLQGGSMSDCQVVRITRTFSRRAVEQGPSSLLARVQHDARIATLIKAAPLIAEIGTVELTLREYRRPVPDVLWPEREDETIAEWVCEIEIAPARSR